ncbi:hypothetical protein AAEJ42_23055, partial [Shewanella algae]|uniref:hypothetical protein n=1 Tax=Shewanella algae TaxID=38313 RepID=UPI00313B3BA8
YRVRETMLQMRRPWTSQAAPDRRLRLGSNSSIIFATQKQSGPAKSSPATDRAPEPKSARNC